MSVARQYLVRQRKAVAVDGQPNEDLFAIRAVVAGVAALGLGVGQGAAFKVRDRKSTRLNSSHLGISYAVFCLKKKKDATTAARHRRRMDTRTMDGQSSVTT